MVTAGPKERSPLRLDLSRLPKAGRARVAASIEGCITTPAATGRKRLKLRPWQREMINGLFDAQGLRGENLQLLARARPSRRRQRLPVQLWGQLLRPCRVLGAATDSSSLQRRSSAAMTRGGRARLAARATEIVSTPRLVGIKGPGSVVNTGSGPLTQSKICDTATRLIVP